MSRPDFARAEAVLRACARRPALLESYRDYWVRLVPRTRADYMDRWVFSATSYLTTWQTNVNAYRHLTGLGYPLSRLPEAALAEEARRAGCGIYRRRARTLHAVDAAFWRHPQDWYPFPGEPLAEFRDRLVPRVPGLGMAKVSFVVEMLAPGSCAVVCVDRHVLDLYGLEKTAAPEGDAYRAVEAHWVWGCKRLGLAAPLARAAWWDSLRSPPRASSRYWMHVFERPGADYGPARARPPLRVN